MQQNLCMMYLSLIGLGLILIICKNLCVIENEKYGSGNLISKLEFLARGDKDKKVFLQLPGLEPGTPLLEEP
ncbi:hypothetical protein L1887_11953 [Cichorium endivia]|nr:hypothetical protein L1887_11953 [Cichorium endivia]